MSLESGRKIGLAASLIEVIVPVVTIITIVVFIFSLFTTALARSSGLISGIIIFFIVLAILGLIGIILFVVAMHSLAQYYSEPRIFKNALYGFILNIIGGVAYGIIYLAIFLWTFLQAIPRTGPQTAAATPSPFPSIPPFMTAPFAFAFVGFIIASIVLFVIGIIAAFLYYRAFNKLGEKSGINNFNTAGLLILIGTIVPVVSWIGWIFAERGFQSLKPKVEQPTTPINTTQSLTESLEQKKYCPHCGSENKANAIYCGKCGNKLP